MLLNASQRISAQVPNSTYNIDENKCVTRMWFIIHAVQILEMFLGFSKSMRRNRRKRNPNDCYWLNDAHLGESMFVCFIIYGCYWNCREQFLLGTLSMYGSCIRELEKDHKTRQMLLPKKTNIFLWIVSYPRGKGQHLFTHI